jgi:hypothetical protein
VTHQNHGFESARDIGDAQCFVQVAVNRNDKEEYKDEFVWRELT